MASVKLVIAKNKNKTSGSNSN